MKKPSLANSIIVFCVAVSLFITVAVVYEYHRLNTVMTSGVVSALMGLWGGELLTIALRQIFGSDAVAKSRSNTNSGGSI